MVIAYVMKPGNFTVQPNQAVALQPFGEYIDTVRSPGSAGPIPLTRKRRSLSAPATSKRTA